jgi:tetratricopeptide (TPR) repeat protein
MGSKIVSANAWHCIGVARQQLREYDSSLVALSHSLAVREVLEHRRGLAETHRKLAEVQLALGDRENARENYQKSLDGFRSLGNEALAQQVESDMQTSNL